MVSSDSQSDAELLAAAPSDPPAFGRFYDRYEAAVAGYFMRRGRHADVAADLTAEVFAAALSATPRYRPDGSTAAVWLFTIAQHASQQLAPRVAEQTLVPNATPGCWACSCRPCRSSWMAWST